MIYRDITPGRFLSRPNRFIARVEAGGRVETCHVKNTGRCAELFLPGAEVYIQKAQNPLRKTQYDLIAVRKGSMLVNVDSAAPNRVFAEWAAASGQFGPAPRLFPERRYGQSRFDFYIEAGDHRIWAETKGVTLERDGVALFPDAPTERGVKHIRELIQSRAEGYRAVIAFIIQLKGVRHFAPNEETHPAFGEALRAAAAAGVEVLALDCRVTPESLTIEDFVPVRL